MELTVGFLTLFLLIVIPGLLFRRFFYYGEFSKQFNTKETVYQSIFYSIIPGVLLQLFGALCYFIFRETELNFSAIYLILNDILGVSEQLSITTKDFLDYKLHLFLVHNLNIYILAIIGGVLISRIIRFFKWDIKFKVFRYKNQWYYIFSGEILLMKKFKSASSMIVNYHGVNKKSSGAFADILIENSTGIRELYSGFVVDYDLNNDDITILDKIYLLDARRYKRLKKEGKTQTSQISIPGEVFILKADQILNINLTFLPYLPEKKYEKKYSIKQSVYKYFYIFTSIIQFSFLIFILFFKKESYKLLNYFYSEDIISFDDFNFFARLFILIATIQLLSIFSPIKKTSKYTYRLNYVIARSITAIIFFVMFWFFYIYL
tara:strand:+ start:18338 stop:19468 length:1131 start_codon:yes stop_codon:yes gene_type:complete